MTSPAKFILYKRSNGYWYIGYEQDDGRRRWKSTGQKLKQEALNSLSQFKELIRTQPDRKSFTAFAQDFLKYAEATYSKGTVAIYKTAVRYLQEIVGSLSLSEITALHWDSYKANRLQQLSPVTTNIELRALRAAMSTAVRWKMLERNPFSRLKFVPVPESVPVYFTKKDFERLLSLIKEGWLKEVVIFATLTGLRRGEIVNLRWTDVDLHRRIVVVQSSPTFKTKAGKRRIVPLSDTAYFLLNNRHGIDNSEYVFTLNGKQIFDDWLTNFFRRYVRKAHLPRELHFHSLRHSFASWLAEAGISIYQISRLLGHSSVTTTQTFYAHLQTESMHKVMNKIKLDWKN